MKIALLFHALAVEGGSPRLFLNLAKALKVVGHDVHVYTYFLNKETYDENLIRDLNIVTRVSTSDSSKFTSATLFSRLDLAKDYFITSKKWAKSVRGEDFDVINPHEAIAYKTALEIGSKAPIAWYVADPAAYVNKVGVGRLYDTNPVYRMMLNLFAYYDKRIVRKLNKVLIPNNYLKDIMDRYYSIETQVVRISGVDTEHFVSLNNYEETRHDLAKRFGIPTDVPLAMSASILMWHRRFEDAISAVSSLIAKSYKIHYMIVGSSKAAPDYKQHLEKHVNSLGIEKFVHFIDSYITDEQMLNLYNACDIFLYPNENQTWGLSPLEAMSVGKPVIVTKGAGVHEVLRDGENAFIVNKRDVTAMAKKLQLFLDDERLRRQISAQGRIFVRENMTWEKCAERLVQAFEHLMS